MSTVAYATTDNGTVSAVTVPTSFNESPRLNFRDTDLEYSRFFVEDFIHKKLLNLKYQTNCHAFSFITSGALDFNLDYAEGSNRVSNITINVNSHGLKWVFKVKDVDVELISADNSFRIWSNFGAIRLSRSMPLYLTTKLKSNINGRLSGYVCLESKEQKINSLTRLDIKEGLVPYLNQKIIYDTLNGLNFGSTIKLNLLNLKISRWNLFAAYNTKNYSLYFERLTQDREVLNNSKHILAGIYRFKAINVLAKVAYRPDKADAMRYKVGVSNKEEQSFYIKAKMDNNLRFTLSARYKQNLNWTLLFGLRVHEFISKEVPPGSDNRWFGFGVEYTL